MKAVILVGGYGTRLRPLTFSKPKPLVPFANKAIALHQIEALAKVGVNEIILAVNVQPETMMCFLRECEKKFKIKITCSLEEVPMGTAGPLALAKTLLLADDEPFFMFNSDVICTFPLDKMLAFHKNHGKEGTIMVTKVQDPSKYGVVVHQPNGKIDKFVEKPQVFVGDEINAGMYILNNAVLDRIELKPTSIERVIFPQMVADDELFCMLLPGYWMDIGQPRDYLRGMTLHLDFLEEEARGELKVEVPVSTKIRGPVMIDSTATIGEHCEIGPHVVIGPNVVIGDGVRIQRTALFAGTKVFDHAWICSSIIGWDCKIGRWSRVDSCVLGEDVSIAHEVYTSDITVCPHKGVKSDEKVARVIL